MAFSSYAAIASASDALSSPATSSELLPDKSFSLRSTYAISSEGLEYTLMAGVYDSSYKLVSSRVGTRKEEVGNYVRYSFPELTSGQKYGRVYYNVSSVPSFGTYGVTASFKEANVGLDPSTASNGAFIILGSGSDYVNTEWTDVRTSVSSSGSTYNVKGNITFDRYIQSINVGFYFTSFLNTFDILVPKSNPVALSFSSKGDVTAVPPSTGSAGDGFQYEVASGLSTIGDTLEEIVLTISYQLEALWDQMYNFMHLPQMEKLEAIRQAIENIRLDVDVDNQDVVNKLDEQIQNDNNNTHRVEEAVEKHGNFIIEGLKSLFIPDEEYFSSLFDRLHQFFSDRLGFLYVPFDLLIRLLDAVKDADTAFAGIPFPGIQAGEWVLLEPTTVTFDILNEFPELVSALHFITSVVMIGAFLNLLHRKMEEVMSR